MRSSAISEDGEKASFAGQHATCLYVNEANLIEKIIEISGTKMQIKKIPPRREFEIRSQFLSDLKAKRLLGWNPKHTLEEGLKKTIPWYKAYLRK